MKNALEFRILVLILFFANQTFAQDNTVKYSDKSERLSPWVFAVPAALLSYGIITRFSPVLQDFDRRIDSRILHNVNGRYAFDDYIQYMPYIGIYIPDLCGVKPKHNIIDRTLVLATSTIICTAAVQIPKRTVHIERPDGSNRHSFPSGHTATAFLGAHILFREYRDVSPWIGIAGYGVAATTGVMRGINRKHWLSDVLAGAGIGIISVELSCRMLPVWRSFFKLNRNLTVSPSFIQDSFGLGITCVF
jgi:membrane-associated phospholipid phosphatase